jgi:hypothetical protein
MQGLTSRLIHYGGLNHTPMKQLSGFVAGTTPNGLKAITENVFANICHEES